MTKANLIAFKDEAAQDGPRAPVQPATSNSEEWIRIVPTPPLRRARHLDVDAVLARSLPKASDAAPGRKSLVN